jgi:hypothetical protein
MSERSETAIALPDLADASVVKVLWAAMCSMTQDVHSPQDQLSADEWAIADEVFRQLDEAVNNAE